MSGRSDLYEIRVSARLQEDDLSGERILLLLVRPLHGLDGHRCVAEEGAQGDDSVPACVPGHLSRMP